MQQNFRLDRRQLQQRLSTLCIVWSIIYGETRFCIKVDDIHGSTQLKNGIIFQFGLLYGFDGIGNKNFQTMLEIEHLVRERYW